MNLPTEFNICNRSAFRQHYYSPLVLITSGVSSSWSCVCVCLAVRTHISVTTGRNFLIWGMLMGYDLGMMPVISKF